MRTQQHIIDTKAVKRVVSVLPDHWVLRDLSERDYGIDLSVELFTEVGKNRFGARYEGTGAVCHLQIKGTAKSIRPKGGVVSFALEKRALDYASRFSTPFFLVRTSTSTQFAEVYFLWIQRYIRDVLDIENPGWREEAPDKKFRIRIPAENTNEVLVDKIERIAYWPKYIEELAEFHEIYSELVGWQQEAWDQGGRLSKTWSRAQLPKLRRVRSFSTLLGRNHCCIDVDTIDAMIAFFDDDDFVSPLKFNEWGNIALLGESIGSMLSIQSFVAAELEETVY